MTEIMAFFAIAALLGWPGEIQVSRVRFRLENETAEMWKGAYYNLNKEYCSLLKGGAK